MKNPKRKLKNIPTRHKKSPESAVFRKPKTSTRDQGFEPWTP